MPESADFVTPWAAVIGSPIAHSLSPTLHRTAYALAGLDWEYRRYEVTAEDLSGFVRGLDSGCVGLSVTMPCKRALIAEADSVDGLAKATGAANTLVIAGGLRAAFNTDVHGIVEAIRDSFGVPLDRLAASNRERNATAVILGTGATASSALAALITLGFSAVSVVGRNFQGADTITMAAARLKVDFTMLYWKHAGAVLEACRFADVIVSTVPDSVSAQVADGLVPNEGQRILDVTYSHGETALARSFGRGGACVVSPLAMLVHQGLAQVKLMSGREVSFGPVYEAVTEAAVRR